MTPLHIAETWERAFAGQQAPPSFFTRGFMPAEGFCGLLVVGRPVSKSFHNNDLSDRKLPATPEEWYAQDVVRTVGKNDYRTTYYKSEFHLCSC